MKMKTLALLTSVLGCSAAFAADDWQYLTFGQSTDLNFKSTVLPEKVGFNRVSLPDHTVLEAGKHYPLYPSFNIESRGGKLANSHDGMSTFYAPVPTNVAFTLTADVTLLQLGPENGNTPNAQEGVGLFIRDSLGQQRQTPQSEGYEEFPHASNMLLNVLLTQNKKNDNLVNLVAVQRSGVQQPWGNTGISMVRKPYEKGVDFRDQTLRLMLERNADGFRVAWLDAEGKVKAEQKMPELPQFLTKQAHDKAYVGFFASRNAAARFDNAKLVIGEEIKEVKAAKALAGKQADSLLELGSSTVSYRPDYTLMLRANYAGEVAVADRKLQVKAGEFVTVPVTLKAGDNAYTLNYTPSEGPQAGKAQSQALNVKLEKSVLADLQQIHVAPNGKADNDGSAAKPVDLGTALAAVAPGGTIYLADGRYDGFKLPANLSGLPNQQKHLVASNRHQAVFTGETSQLEASYWTLDGVVFDGNPDNAHKENLPSFLRVAGSHNVLQRLVARNNADTGVWITGNGTYTSASLWPAYNQVLNTDSYNNRDASGINADGFAAKLGVGPGNLFRGCVAHNNADDGWDLFNKIEDGPNQPVTIEYSVAYENGMPLTGKRAPAGTIGNGFKLGGEGQPVPHQIRYSIAFHNNMDGFTDNFNTGGLVMEKNIAFDNQRYNYIVRQNPYAGTPAPVSFVDNLSLHSKQASFQDFFGKQVVASLSTDFHKQVKAERETIIKSLSGFKGVQRNDNGDLVMPAKL